MSGAMDPPAKKSWAKPEDWARKKAVVTRLYIQENKTLEQLQMIMERDHNFYATGKFKEWDLQKNARYSPDEVLTVLQQLCRKNAVGPAAEVSIRGKAVDPRNLRRYLKRNPDVLHRFYHLTGKQISSMGLTAPRPAPVPHAGIRSAGSGGDDLHGAEHLLLAVRDYIDGHFAAGHWRFAHDPFFCDWDDEPYMRLLDAWQGFDLVKRAIDQNESVDVIGLLDGIFQSLGYIVKNEHPGLLSLLVSAAFKTDRSLGQLLVDYLARLCPIVLGPHHPLSFIWHRLAQVAMPASPPDAVLLERLFALLGSEFEHRLGSLNRLTYVTYLEYSRFADVGPAERAFRRQLAHVDLHDSDTITTGAASTTTNSVAAAILVAHASLLAYHLCAQRRYDDALAFLLGHALASRLDRLGDEARLQYCRTVADAYRRKRDLARAEAWYRDAVRHAGPSPNGEEDGDTDTDTDTDTGEEEDEEEGDDENNDDDAVGAAAAAAAAWAPHRHDALLYLETFLASDLVGKHDEAARVRHERLLLRESMVHHVLPFRGRSPPLDGAGDVLRDKYLGQLKGRDTVFNGLSVS